MAFTKLTSSDFTDKGVQSLPNQPKIGATALKAKFDELSTDVITPAFNNHIDELEAETAAESIGIVAPEGRGTSTNVQGVVDKISLDLAQIEGSFGSVAEMAHSHENKELLDTYQQTEENLADAVASKHAHANKALLDTYSQTESDLSDAVSKKHGHSNKDLLDTYTQANTDIADAVSKKHEHSNKALLDTYTQSDTDIADAVAKRHSHSNKSLLDTYTQSDTDIADAVAKKHGHDNKTVLDKFGESSGGNPTYNGQPIGGTGSGDMLASDYDPNLTVEGAGGIVAYVASQAPVEGDGIDITGLTISLDLNYLTASRLGLSQVAQSGSYSDLSNKPTLGTAAALDVAASGNASTSEVVKGDDTRLTDSRTPTSHTHTTSDISDFPTIPTVNNATLTIQKNGTNVETFTANSSTDKTVNITTDDWVATASVSSGSVTFSGIDDTGTYGYKPYFVVDDNSTNLNPSYEISALSGAGTNNMSITYTTDADNGTNNCKLRRIK